MVDVLYLHVAVNLVFVPIFVLTCHVNL